MIDAGVRNLICGEYSANDGIARSDLRGRERDARRSVVWATAVGFDAERQLATGPA